MDFRLRGTSLLASTAALLLAGTAQAALPPGISGAWFNPAQSGHGLSVEIIAPDRALVFWYTYDPSGNPFNLYLDGRIDGRRISGVGLAPRGMRFGSFDPAELTTSTWGQLSLEFDDCRSGRLNWAADDPAFGSASIPLIRLTGIHAQACTLGDPDVAEPGLYTATIDTFAPDGGVVRRTGIVAVDADGRFWGLQRTGDGALSERIPGPTSLQPPPSVVVASLAEASGASSVRQTGNYWARFALSATAPVRADWDAAGHGTLVHPDAGGRSVRWSLAPSTALRVQPLSSDRLVGRYDIRFDGQFFDSQGAIEFAADGSLCITVALQDPDACSLRGRYWSNDTEAGWFDFELRHVDGGRAPDVAYRGRGWLQGDVDGEALLMVGDDGHTGFGLIAR